MGRPRTGVVVADRMVWQYDLPEGAKQATYVDDCESGETQCTR